MTRRPIISGNWKMNLNHFEALQTVQKLYWSTKPEDFRAVEVTLHPPFTDLRSVQTVIESDSMPLVLGAQHCHWDASGAFTGEISPLFLAKLNVAYVIVGHSERRREFGETDDMVAKKVKAIVDHGMTPILCVGETIEQREAQRGTEVVLDQVRTGISKIKKDALRTLVIAYEPAWAIGAKTAANSDDAQFTAKAIRAAIADYAGADTAESLRIQYGGAVDAGSAAQITAQADIDGLLVGRASLDPETFARIIAAVRG